MRLSYTGDPGYPVGAQFDPRAPFNQEPASEGEFACAHCHEACPATDLAYEQGDDAYCKDCAEEFLGMHPCHHCARWLDENDIAEVAARRGWWICDACAPGQQLSRCANCGLLHPTTDMGPLHDEQCCVDCRAAEIDRCKEQFEEPAPLHPMFAGILRAHLGGVATHGNR